MSDSLGLGIDRKRILCYGLPGSGKSYSVARLVQQMEGEKHNVTIIDRDWGLSEAFKELGYKEEPDNLDYFHVEAWEKMTEARDSVMETMQEGDWVVIEGMHRIWRAARAAYILATYDMTESEFGEYKQSQAQQQIEDFFGDAKNMAVEEGSEEYVTQARKIRSRVMQFEGLDGRTEWPKITNKYFEALEPMFNGPFNILSTTMAKRLDKQGVEDEPQWMGIGFKPEGQNLLIGMHSTLMRVYRKDGNFMFSTDLGDASKDRGNPLFSDIPFDDVGLVQAYQDELDDA